MIKISRRKQLVLFVSFCLFCLVTKAQTEKELIGKWKLVKQTQNGVVTTPAETYQVFNEGGAFQRFNNGKARKGKWSLSDDNKGVPIK